MDVKARMKDEGGRMKVWLLKMKGSAKAGQFKLS